jgi:anti-anti-sigma factor
MNAAEKAAWLAVSPPLAVDGGPRSAKHARRSIRALRAIDLAFHVEGIAVLELRGEHDLSGCERLSEALEAATPQLLVLVDLSDCSFIDSSVVATLFVARKRLLAAGGKLELLVPPEAATVQRIARATSLAAIIPVHETLAAALSSLKHGEAATAGRLDWPD